MLLMVLKGMPYNSKEVSVHLVGVLELSFSLYFSSTLILFLITKWLKDSGESLNKLMFVRGLINQASVTVGLNGQTICCIIC